jgi:hypothetical protein
MSSHELFGTMLLSVLYLAAGLGLLGAWTSSVRRLVRLSGLAYLIGFVAVTVVSVELLVLFDIRPSIVSVSAIALGLAAAGAVARMLKPPPKTDEPRPATGNAIGRTIGAAFCALTLLMVVQLLRLAYTQGLSAWDAWSFWTPKALAIHYEGLDSGLFGSISAHTYPLLVPVGDAAVFAFGGGTDPVALSLQFYLLFVAFLAAAAGLAAYAGARGWTIWPLLATLCVLPAGLGRLLAPQADFALDYFFAIAVAALLLWLRRREPWLLVCAVVLMVGAATTKREGVAFALAAAITLAVAAWRSRTSWLAAVAVVAIPVVFQIPWWLWLRHHGIVAESTGTVVEGGGIAAQVANKPQLVWPALGAILHATFSVSWWGGAGIGGASAVACGLLCRETRRISALVLVLSALVGGIFLWRLLWGGEGSGTNFLSAAYPTRRLTGALVLTWLAVGPVILSRVAAALPQTSPVFLRSRLRHAYLAALLPAAILLVTAVHRGDFAFAQVRCRLLTVPGSYGVVLGPESDYSGAVALQSRVEALGFQHSIVSADICGGVTVVTPNLPTYDIAKSVLVEAESAQLDASIVPGTG